MYFPFSNLKVQNSFFLEFLGNEKVTLKAPNIKQFKQLDSAIQAITIEPSKIEEIVLSIPKANWSDDLSCQQSLYLKQLKSLKYLKIDASQSNITNLLLSRIIMSLIDLQNISSFSLLLDRCFDLNEEYLEIIFKTISKLQSIQFLSISNSQNISEGIYFSYFSQCLQYKKCNLKELQLNYFQNSFDQEAHIHLCKGIAKNNHLKVLVLNNIKIFPLFWVLLVQSLQTNTSLQLLQVDFIDKQNNSQLAKGLCASSLKIYRDIILLKKAMRILVSKEQLAALQLIGLSSDLLKSVNKMNYKQMSFFEEQYSILKQSDLQQSNQQKDQMKKKQMSFFEDEYSILKQSELQEQHIKSFFEKIAKGQGISEIDQRKLNSLL
ncbi:hypothetical protein ABPG72_000591 [Tetrahymena utriculariae]